MRVLMLPHLQHLRSEESGIKRVVEAYFQHMPEFGVEFVTEGMSHDVRVVHAGTSPDADVAACHGLYWTGDYPAITWEWAVNKQVIDSLRGAKEITVPSEWVAEAIRRDMRRQPHVVGHGIDWEDWQEDPEENSGYVLWNKNRQSDVCNPAPVVALAKQYRKVHFVSTFAGVSKPGNISLTGVIPHSEMMRLIKAANIYLSTTKETFGIGTLEAMAAGVPVLGYAHGGNLDLVEHGVTGYLAQPNSLEDLGAGLEYCLKHRNVLGANARERARQYSWDGVCQKILGVWTLATKQKPASVTVVIPSYNYADRVRRAILSVQKQTFENFECIIVDDGSTDGSEQKIPDMIAELKDRRFGYLRQGNSGVAVARNRGIAEGDGKYVCCLDADDAMNERFLEVCVRALEQDASLGIAYTGLWYIKPDGSEGVSPWPPQWDFDKQLERRNQVPTCCVFRREMWEALGGYRARYCPQGAGSEDAEFWTRSGAYGWAARKVSEEPLFIYSWMSGRVSGASDYHEVDWLAWHPWARDGQHPFASYARPKRWSHPVRQYDEPVVSVVIPLGPGHEQDVVNALDSLDAQTFRSWEAILVNDTGNPLPEWLAKAFPHVRKFSTDGKKGAGHARNVGAQEARGPFLLFLDADDWLYPEFLDKTLRVWETHSACIYTDYVGRAVVDPDHASKMMDAKRLLYYDRDSGNAIISHQAADYDWQRAQRQPDTDRPWIWCNITTLLPRAWHIEVGGFDETMPSWEDADYWYRMARMGKPFVRLPEQLMVYQFHSGNRRQTGYESHQALTAYLQEKYKEIEVMPCVGCRGRGSRPPAPVSRPSAVVSGSHISDDDFVMCEYISTKRNQHPIVGTAGFEFRFENLHMIRGRDGLWHIHYGFRAAGDRFIVHRRDVEMQPHVYQELVHREVVPPKQPAPPPPPSLIDMVEVAPEPEQPTLADIAKIDRSDGIDEAEAKLAQEILDQHDEERFGAKYAKLKEIESTDPQDYLDALEEKPGQIGSGKPDNGPLNLQLIPGITPLVADELTANGITTVEDFLSLGQGGLQRFKGIGEVRAKSIWTAISKMEEDAQAMARQIADDDLEAENAAVAAADTT